MPSPGQAGAPSSGHQNRSRCGAVRCGRALQHSPGRRACRSRATSSCRTCRLPNGGAGRECTRRSSARQPPSLCTQQTDMIQSANQPTPPARYAHCTAKQASTGHGRTCVEGTVIVGDVVESGGEAGVFCCVSSTEHGTDDDVVTSKQAELGTGMDRARDAGPAPSAHDIARTSVRRTLGGVRVGMRLGRLYVLFLSTAAVYTFRRGGESRAQSVMCDESTRGSCRSENWESLTPALPCRARPCHAPSRHGLRFPCSDVRTPSQLSLAHPTPPFHAHWSWGSFHAMPFRHHAAVLPCLAWLQKDGSFGASACCSCERCACVLCRAGVMGRPR